MSLAPLASQSPSSPSIAPLAPGATTNGPSPLFNWVGADTIWNLGEGIPLNTGGAISQSDPSNLQIGDLHVLKPFGAQGPGGVLDTNTFVGDLRPAGTPVGLPLSESSF